MSHDSDERYRTLVKIWIAFTTVWALCGMKFDLFWKLWLWFFVACMVVPLLSWVVAMLLYPYRSKRYQPPERPYRD